MEWRTVAHLSTESEHIIKSKANIDGIEVIRETVTHMNKKTGDPGKGKNYFYMESSSKIYKTIEELKEVIKTLDK